MAVKRTARKPSQTPTEKERWARRRSWSIWLREIEDQIESPAFRGLIRSLRREGGTGE